jgi:hypothetical protein
MIRLDNLPAGIASRMLAHTGITAIWELQVAAGLAYRVGNVRAAASIMELADAAEREWMRAMNTSTNAMRC